MGGQGRTSDPLFFSEKAGHMGTSLGGKYHDTRCDPLFLLTGTPKRRAFFATQAQNERRGGVSELSGLVSHIFSALILSAIKRHIY